MSECMHRPWIYVFLLPGKMHIQRCSCYAETDRLYLLEQLHGKRVHVFVLSAEMQLLVMKNIFNFLILTLLATSLCRASDDNIELQWRGRGLEASERLVELLNAPKNKIPKSEIRLNICKAALEFGFDTFKDKGSKEIFKDQNGGISFFLSFFDDNGKGITATIGFIYGTATGRPIQIMASKLAKGWAFVSSLDGKNGTFLLMNKNCSWAFDPSDYLHPNVLVRH